MLSGAVPESRILFAASLYTFSFNSELFSSQKSLLSMSLSDMAFNSKLSGIDLIRQESRIMCKDKVWAPFLCILAFSSGQNSRHGVVVLPVAKS